MSESSTLKLRPTSPLSVNRNVALNSALSWKIWLRLEDYAESINQAFSLQFGELDTVDDLKTKIFENLNTIRWSRVNDNSSIAIGFYCDRTDWENDKFSPIQRLPTSPVDTVFGRNKPLQQPSAASTKRGLADDESKNCSLNTSPRISASTSPKLSAAPKLSTTRYGPSVGSPFLSVQGGLASNNGRDTTNNNNSGMNSFGFNQNNTNGTNRLPTSVLPTLSPLPFSGGKLALTSWSKKNLKHNVEHVGGPLYRILFEPDELVITLYNELFGHLGSQTAADALLVFCSDIVPEPEQLPYSAIDGHNFTVNELTQELLNSQDKSRGHQGIGLKTGGSQEILQSGLETPPTVGILNTGDDDAPPDLSLDHTISQLAREESEREFQLITNEEQLRKVSQSMQDEDNPDSPKQAILLLPRDFDGNVNFNETPPKVSSEPSSPRAIIDNVDNMNREKSNGGKGDHNSRGSTFNNNKENTNHCISDNEELYLPMPLLQRPKTDDNLIPTHAPLSEKEVGMVHPLLESDRKKGLSSPTSPLLPRNPPPSFNRLSESLSPRDTTARGKAFPGEWSATSDKVFPKINVLIVEDNVINQTILSSFLRKHKIFHKVAKNGQEAIDIWRQGGIHLIFMDLQLPVLSGIDAAKKIRELEREHGIGIQKSRKRPITMPKNETSEINEDQINAPVIIVAFTASKSQGDKREALISGCNDYLTKPVNLHWLSNKINEWGCMQALINFDSWKEGQSRMTENVLIKAPSHRSIKTISGNPDIKCKVNRRSRSSSNSSQSKIAETLRLAP